MNLRTSLFDHQRLPLDKLLRSRVAGLFMDMGTGKSRCAIEFVARRRARIDRVIWFCPVALKATVDYEIRKHTDAADADINVFDDHTTARTAPRSALWHVVGIESMSSSDRVALAARDLITPETFVIVDESSYIKGHRSTRTRRITHFSEQARYRMLLTGTPMSQGVQDLYAQMRFLSSKILGYSSFYSFAANHLEYSEKYPGLIVRAHNTGWLAAKMQPYVYQITKDEAGLNLPPKIYDRRYYHLTTAQVEAYEQAKWEFLMSCPDELLDSYVIFQLFTALQQIVSGFWNRDDHLLEFPHHRLDILDDVIAGVPEEKIIVWCKYRYSVEAIARQLTEKYGLDAVSRFYGDLSEAERGRELERFRREARFFVATMATGGHGLTLNESAYAIFYENGFKYAERIQAEDRNHRLGQSRRPTYIDIVSFSKIEDRISDSLARKGDAVDDFRRKVQAIKGLTPTQVREHVMELL